MNNFGIRILTILICIIGFIISIVSLFADSRWGLFFGLVLSMFTLVCIIHYYSGDKDV